MDNLNKLEREHLLLAYLNQQIETAKTILDGDDHQYSHLDRAFGRIEGVADTILFLWPNLEPETQRTILEILVETAETEDDCFENLGILCHVLSNKLSTPL